MMSKLLKLYIVNPTGGCDRKMALGNFQCRGVLLIWIIVGEGSTVLAYGSYLDSLSLSLSLTLGNGLI